jgi:hypothetical protein
MIIGCINHWLEIYFKSPKKEFSLKEQRLNKRFSAKLPARLKVITPSRTRVLDVETKDISATGAFIYTKEASYIPNDTLLILNSSNSNKKRIRLKKLKPLENCTGTIVRSTSEGIAIRFSRPIELFV